jgi:pSer/pThr/pTyr-binding forkhead associated (FHA) protein
MSPLRVLRGFILGALGGILGWVLTEFLPLPFPFQLARFEAPGMVQPPVGPGQIGLYGLALGIGIGLFLGISEGMGEGTTSQFRRTFLVFLVLGAAGGFLGLYFGQILYARLGGKVDPNDITLGEFFPQLLARALAWMLIGFFTGIALGVSNLSTRRMVNGMVGGAIGGFLSGAVFQLMVFTRVFSGIHSRFVGFAMLGAMIGFFISLVAEVFKRVWVKVLIGRNEGREHVLDTPIAYVGRDEMADVPVFLDPSVPKRMASFRLNNGRYALFAESNALPITVNGQPLTAGQVLRDGDAIQFGRITLGFFEKATASGMPRAVDRVALADFSTPSVVPGATPIPTGPNVCEFCGQQKDRVTGACACTVPGGPAAYDPQAGQGYQPAPDYSQAGYAPTMDYGQAAYPPPSGYDTVPMPMGVPQPGDYGDGATMVVPAAGGGFAPGDGGGARLVAIAGPHAGQVFPLHGMEAGIGREPTQEIPLAGDSTASRRHARLVNTGAGWLLRDEGSSNGTWVNGVRVQEQPLFPGDTVRVGQSQFRFEA